MTAAEAKPRTATTVERIEAPSREEFQRDYVAKGKPVILTGLTDGWAAVHAWDADYLRQAAGDAEVRVPFEDAGDFFSWFSVADTRKESRMPLGGLLDKLTDEDPDTRYYMTEQPLADISRDLLTDADLSRYVDDVEPAMFMGKNTFMPCHFHGHTEALLCQLRSDKEVTLFSPKDWARLYAHPWYSARYQFSRVDVRAPDLDRFPRFADATPITFTLRAGEILYIPVHWWHTTGCAEFNFNITYFWPSKLRRFNYPTPGIQYHAHWALFSVAMPPVHALKRALRR